MEAQRPTSSASAESPGTAAPAPFALGPTASSLTPLNAAPTVQSEVLRSPEILEELVLSDSDSESDGGEIWHDGRPTADAKPPHESAPSASADDEDYEVEITHPSSIGRPWWLSADGRINRKFYEFTPPKTAIVAHKLLEMRELRLPAVRAGRDVSRLDPKEKRDTQEGLLMQSRGDIAPMPCESCAAQRGAFTSCVVVPSLKRICASCRLAHKNCSIGSSMGTPSATSMYMSLM